MAWRKVKGLSVQHDRARDRWRLRFHIDKQRWSRGYATKALTHTAADEYAARIKRGEDVRPRDLREPEPPARQEVVVTPGSVRDLGNKWITAEQQQRGSNTNDSYAGCLLNHIYPALGDVRVHKDTLTRDVCKAFVQGLVGKVSTRTTRRLLFNSRKAVLSTLTAFCTWAVDEQQALPFNPAKGLRKYIRDPDELKRPVVVWTHEQADRLLAVALERMPHWYPYLYVAIHTGPRGGELIELRWDEDFTTPGHMTVQRQALSTPRKRYATTKGALTRERDRTAVRVVPTKGRETRLIPLRLDVQRVLDQHRAAQRAWAFKQGRPVPQLVFTTITGKRVILTHFRRRVLKPLCQAAKIPFTSKGHTTRHTFATVLLARGVALDKVSEWLGHKAVAVTESVYKHWIRDPRRDEELGQLVDAAWRVDRD